MKNKTTKIRVYDIVWDTDGEIESEIADLPCEVVITLPEGWDGDEEAIGDCLSNEYGYCHYEYKYEVL